MPNGGINKLRDLIRLYYGDGLVTRRNESDVTIGTSAGSIVGPNPQRVALYLSNWGAASIAIGLTRSVTATTGIIIPTLTGIQLVWLTDLDFVSEGIFGISAGAGNALHVVETVMVGEVS